MCGTSIISSMKTVGVVLSPGAIRHEKHMKAIIIDMDEIKKTFPGYNLKNPNKHHEKSSTLAKGAFQIALDSSQYQRVILMGGGSASGKTEFISSELVGEKAIIFDGTLGGVNSTEKKIKKAHDGKKKVEVCAIIPENIVDTFNAFVLRKRRVPVKIFFKTHSDFRKTLLWLIQKYPNIHIRIIQNKGLHKGTLIMDEIEFTSKSDRDNFILNCQIDKDEIEEKIVSNI